MTTIFATILVLGVLVFVHELGHFLVARLCGVGVIRFSLGFGPKLFGIVRGGTEYRVSAIPLGGYVKMVGEHPGEEEEAASTESDKSFAEKSVWARLAIVAAGPVSNFILAVVIFALVLMIWGVPQLTPTIGTVMKDYPAAKAGLKPGDKIEAVAGVKVETWDSMAGLIRQAGFKPLELTVRRDGRLINLTLTPTTGSSRDVFGQPITKPMIGISPSGETFTDRRGLFGAIVGGLVQTWDIADLTFRSIGKMISRQIPLSSVGGPIFIAEAAGKQAKAGVVNLLFFMGLISVNLGLLNILPIPVLDGGHILFFLLEALFRRPVPRKVRERAMQVGVAFLITFMVVVFYNDIVRFVSTRFPGAG